MKPILIFLLFYLQIPFSFANSPLCDIIRMDGKEWKLLTKPLNWDSAAYSRIEKLLPAEYKWPRSSKWNYIGYWTVEDKRICLEKLKVLNGEKEQVYGKKDLERMFAGFNNGKGIHALWINAEVRAGRGKENRYPYGEYRCYMEEEYLLGIYKGVVVKKQLYHNYKVRDGFRVDNVQSELEKRFPFEEFPEMEGKEIRLSVDELKVSPDGHLLDCKRTNVFLHRIKFLPTDRRNQMVKAFEKAMKSIYPWEVSYVNGEYTVASTENFIRLYYPVLTAYTKEEHPEHGTPVCYLNVRKDTVIPFGKYRYCGSDTIRHIGFVLDRKIVCINNRGEELFKVFNYDNGPDHVKEGRFRIQNEDGRIGFADARGNIVIQPQYAFAYPFKNNRAKVTYSGERRPVDEKLEHWNWESDYWFYIDREGNYVTDDPNVKTTREYVESGEFISIIPKEYHENLSKHVYSKAEKQNLDNQMKAVIYRFYKHCTMDEKGIITCHITSGREINVSEEVFADRIRDMEWWNKGIEEMIRNGTKYKFGRIDREEYFEELINH